MCLGVRPVCVGILGFALCLSAASAQDFPQYPVDVAVDSDGSVLVVDRDLPGVWRVKDETAEILVTGSNRNREPLNAPRCVAVDGAGRVLVGDSSGCNVYIVQAGEAPRPISSQRIGIPMSIAVDGEGNVYVADLELHRILKVGDYSDGPAEVTVVAQVRAPRGLAFDSKGNLWIVAGSANPIQRMSADGELSVVVSGRQLRYPAGISVTSTDRVLVSDSYAKSLVEVAEDGTLSPVLEGAPLEYPVGISWGSDALWVADSKGRKLHRVTESGEVSTIAPAQ